MKKIKDIIKALFDTFMESAEKIDKGTATDEEAMAYGCLYALVAFATLFLLCIFAVVVSLIRSLL